jgi:membrane-bound lytic murein transglycosylase D
MEEQHTMKTLLLRLKSPFPHGAALLAAGAVSLLLAGCASTLPPSTPASVDGMPTPALLPVQPTAPQAPATPAAPAAPAAAESAQPVDPLRPDVPVDLGDQRAQQDLWERVRRGFAIPDLDTDLVRNREQWYATRPDYVKRMTERGSLYLYHIVDEIERRGLPTELALLPFIESAFNPNAMSVAKASGMWQFVPSTGRDFALKQNLFRDDRRDVLASTRAALDYLTRLHDEFQDWHLALAAYNWGEGSVRRAIARNERDGLPTDYLSLRMPEETRYYVPKLQAVKNIIARPDGFGLALPTLANHPYFLSVPIERDIDVALAARFAQMPVEEFKQLNPQMNKPVILAAGTPQVLLPYDNANDFVRNLQSHKGPLASWTAWVATRTLRPKDAAKELGVSEQQLRELNHIPGGMLVKAGSTLLVPRSERVQDDVSEHVADNATIELAPDLPPLKRVSFKAGRKGESVASVARRWHVGVAQVAQWNKVAAGGHFKAGQVVVLWLPAQRAALAAVAADEAESRAAARSSAPAKAQAKASGRAVGTRTASAAKAAAGRTAVAAQAARRATRTAAAAKDRASTKIRVAAGR